MANRERFAVLEGMRGLAALIVITDQVPTGLLGTLLPGRYLAVDFFFMMSGFVIARAYGERLQAGWSHGRLYACAWRGSIRSTSSAR